MAEVRDIRGVVIKPGDQIVGMSRNEWGGRGLATVVRTTGKSRVYVKDTVGVKGKSAYGAGTWMADYVDSSVVVVVTGFPEVEE